jgi:ABC-2 type transport system permease protein
LPNKTFLIFKHEFRRTVRRTGFIILALSLPVLALLAIGIFQIVSGITKPPAEATKIGYVDEIGGFNQFTSQGNIILVGFATPPEATQALIKKDIKEYFVIPADFLSTGIINRFTAQRELAPPDASAAAIKNFMARNLLAGKVSESAVDWIEAPLNLVTTTLTSTGEVAPQQGGFANFIVPGIFSLLLMFALIFGSVYVLQSLSEEKENRLMEILLSSVSTRELLAGKVLALGAAGLLQVIIWLISLPLLLKLSSSTIGGILSTIQLSPEFLALGIVYFILGYLVFAVLSASIAAISPTVQEAQGFSSIYSLFAIAPFWFLSLLLIYPNSPIWVVISCFPFSAPVLMMLRLGISDVPAWQIAISLTVMLLSIFAGLWLAARLLRTYLLMYGKRPGLRQIIRNLRAG